MESDERTYSLSELRKGVQLTTGHRHVLKVGDCPSQSFKGVFSCACWQASAQDPKIAATLRKLWSRFGDGIRKLIPGLIDVDEQPYGFDDDGAARALKHYLNGSGDFVEIPQEKVASIRKEWEETHLKKAYAAFQNGIQLEGVYLRFHGGSKNLLALQWLTTRSGRALPPSNWPESPEITMTYADGPQESPSAIAEQLWLSSEYRDDFFEYFGSQICSEATILCHRVGPLSYSLVIKEWRAYVVDNYDWEGKKRIGLPRFPSQSEMRRLAEVGCAKAYKRSSRFWVVSVTRFESWQADYDPPQGLTLEEFLEALANARRAEKMQPEERGALPLPGPADTMSGRKMYWWFEPDNPHDHNCL